MRPLLLVAAVWLASGCGLRERELTLERKSDEISRKEQELALRENALQLREATLAEREKQLDSTHQAADSLAAQHPGLPGLWSVRMHCTETTCPGSAVGDTKNEQWDFSFRGGTVIVRAMSGNKVIRIYTGAYAGNTLELAAGQDPGLQGIQMTVRLQEAGDRKMEGHREIIRPANCRILYTLELNKQQASL